MLKNGPLAGDAQNERFKEVMGWVNDFIKPTGFVGGTDHLTVADIAFLATFRLEKLSIKATLIISIMSSI